jgi:hypothetical protein
MRLTTLDPHTISRQLYICGGLCSVLFLNTSYPKEIIQDKQIVDLRQETDIVIILMCVKQHYALLEVAVNMKLIAVYMMA